MGSKRIVYGDKKEQQVAAEWLLAWIVSNGSLLRVDLTDEYTSWWNLRTTPLDTGISDVLLGVTQTQFKLSRPMKTVSNYPRIMVGWKSLLTSKWVQAVFFVCIRSRSIYIRISSGLSLLERRLEHLPC